VVDVVPLAKVTLAPLAGLLNVTSSFAMGMPDESVTVACRFAAKGVETVADWPPPAIAATDAGDRLTVRSAAALVTLPALFVTVTVKLVPVSPADVAGTAYVADVAPAIGLPPLFH